MTVFDIEKIMWHWPPPMSQCPPRHDSSRLGAQFHQKKKGPRLKDQF
jgi:hypothetical protein